MSQNLLELLVMNMHEKSAPQCQPDLKNEFKSNTETSRPERTNWIDTAKHQTGDSADAQHTYVWHILKTCVEKSNT